VDKYSDILINGGFGELSSISQLDEISLDALGIENKIDRDAILSSLPQLKEQVSQSQRAQEEEAAVEELRRQERQNEEMKKYQEYQQQQYSNDQYYQAYYGGNEQYAYTDTTQNTKSLVDYGSDNE